MEKTFYNISESEGVVEICVNASGTNALCPSSQTFQVTLSTAGIQQFISKLLACQSLFHAVSPTDYEAVDVTLTFQPCDRQQCVNVSITDDLINEPEERFAVSLTLSGGDNPPYVTLGSATGEIVITDDDGKDELSLKLET